MYLLDGFRLVLKIDDEILTPLLLLVEEFETWGTTRFRSVLNDFFHFFVTEWGWVKVLSVESTQYFPQYWRLCVLVEQMVWLRRLTEKTLDIWEPGKLWKREKWKWVPTGWIFTVFHTLSSLVHGSTLRIDESFLVTL